MALTRRGAAWLLTLPLLAAGAECAHWLAYRLVYPDPYVRAQVLAQTGHGYLHELPAAAAAGGALVLSGFLARVLARRGAAHEARASLAPVLALPSLAFALQEGLELGASGHSPLMAVFAPTFLPGVVLALPFAAVAYVLSRALLAGADRLAEACDSPTRVWRSRRVAVLLGALAAPRSSRLTGGLVERGPPVHACCS